MKKLLKRRSSILLLCALLLVMVCAPLAAKSVKVIATGRQTYLTHQVTVYPTDLQYPGREVGKMTLNKWHTVYASKSNNGMTYIEWYVSTSGQPTSHVYGASVRSDYVK